MECGDRFAIALDEGQAHGSRQCSNRTRLPGAARSKKGGACGTAKFREKTSKKADSATRGRIAAVHKVAVRIVQRQGIYCGAAFTKAGHGPPAQVAILHCTAASLGNNVRTPPPRRGAVVLHLGVRSAG